MRLVDIDELKKHDHWRKTVDDLRCAPTVEAIPVNWLKEKLINYPEISHAITDGIIEVLNLWEREKQITAANNRPQINQIYEANKMQRKIRDNRTRMQRKEDRNNTIASFCLFSCAVLAFCAGICKITAPKLKSQEGALKCETEAR